jgi:hypothetical protein
LGFNVATFFAKGGTQIGNKCPPHSIPKSAMFSLTDGIVIHLNNIE